MTARIRTITFDCADPYRLSLFWTAVTGYVEDPDNPNLPEHEEDLICAPDGSANLLFIKVLESKILKNRVHLDLVPPDSDPATRDDEMARLLELGATLVDDRRRPDGTGWVVLADPEGNEFCLERGVVGG
jgi:hypothetical protein